jgi:hypothetical protein
MPPVLPGWLVVYRGKDGTLQGGADDPAHGTVQRCWWDGTGWTVHLDDGQRLPLWMVRSVRKTDREGRVIAAWTVREHGFDGNGNRQE